MWKNILVFCSRFPAIRGTKSHNYQYKIIHRIVTMYRKNLFDKFYNKIGDIRQVFLLYEKVHPFWQNNYWLLNEPW